MIELELTQDFPAGLDRLWAVFGRPDYPVKKYLALGATAVRTVRFSASAQAIDVELERDVPVETRVVRARTLEPSYQAKAAVLKQADRQSRSVGAGLRSAAKSAASP